MAAERRKEADSIVHLRPHHLLCVPRWRGHGYDAAFSANMDAVAAALALPGAVVDVVWGGDGVCAACPHWQGDGCREEAKVRRLDEGVAAALALRAGRYVYAALTARALDGTALCADCEWRALCREVDVSRASHPAPS